ncbi:MAG: lipopolysaccharide heptosyltransferase II [Limnobacter sp.]|nr:lipopolysaccharide heptosyltransferase II [Limnobacter sp.]
MRILLIAPNWIGDAVMSLSLVQALYYDPSKRQPDGSAPEIHVLAPAATAPVYRFSWQVASVQTEPFQHGQLQWRLRRQVGKGLRQAGYDLAIALPNSLKSALLPWFARIPKRVGYAGELRSLFLTQALPKPSKTNKPPMVEWYGKLAGYQTDTLPNPSMQLSPVALFEVLSEFHLPQGYLALAPGAEYGPAKRWPAEHFAQVARDFLTQHSDQQVAIHGGPKDVDFSNHILQLIPAGLQDRVQVLAGKTRLEQAIGLLAGACALVTNDSGLMHVGAAMNIPVHAVFGSSSPKHTPPLHPEAKVYYLGLECSPCFERECPLGHTHCLVHLKPEMVTVSLLKG